MLKKQYVKTRKVAKVTFELPTTEIPEEIGAESASVVGDFNGWDPLATPMTYSKKKKAFWATVELEPGQSYQFRYFVNGQFWFNDRQADMYLPGEFGDDNCVVVAPSGPEALN
jgi:1,4-alpha-glucan branching enzyme